jgi:hypothetical protein
VTEKQILGWVLCVGCAAYLAFCLWTGETRAPHSPLGGKINRQDSPVTYWVTLGYIAFGVLLGAMLGLSHA